MLQISYSGLQTYAACPQKYRNVYIEGRVKIPTFDAKSVGSVVHEGLALLISGKPLDLTPFASQVSPEDACLVAAMLMNWPRRWEWEPRYDVIGVEVPFEVPIRNPKTNRAIRGIRYRGFVDAVLRDPRTGLVYILEHKTTSDTITGFGPYWARLAIDDQIALYQMVFGAEGIIYNVGKKPKLKPSAVDRKNAGGEEATESDILDAFTDRLCNVLQNEPEEWYQWRQIYKTPEERLDAAQGLYDRAQTLLVAYRHGRWPKHPGACRTIYGVCEYLEVCTGRARLDDDALFMDKAQR